MATFKILVVGLGNIPLPSTRHSVGHLIVDSLADRLGATWSRTDKHKGFIANAAVELNESPFDVTLFKPFPLMNLCGPSIASAMRGTVDASTSLVVIHDSLNHSQGEVHPKFGGSPEGHRGVRSVISSLNKNQDFHRLRIGIGRRGDAKEYVLGPLSSFEKQHWGPNGEGIDNIWDNLNIIARSIRGIQGSTSSS